MTEWPHVLRNHDPIEPLGAEDAAAIRRRVIAEALTAASVPVMRLAPVFAIGSALMIAAVAGVFVARAYPDPEPRAIPAPGEMRQLQFSTPGGTRIIWHFNPEFSLRETHP